jgi:hypothetical protein
VTIADNKHTPGPWRAGGAPRKVNDTEIDIAARLESMAAELRRSYEYEPATIGIDQETTGDGVPIAEVIMIDGGEAPANARLIAAAPDLLAACERGLAALRSALDAACLGEGADVDALVAAIEKARAK